MDTKYLEIIKAPLVTEKTRDGQQNGKYTFLVSEKATKTEIKEAIEKLFKVEVVSIQTLNIKVKKKRKYPLTHDLHVSLVSSHISHFSSHG